jgi:hypothetical protein
MPTVRDTKIRYYPSERFPEAIGPELKEESRLQWDALYSLRDKAWDVREFVLNGTRAMNIQTTIGKPLLVILIQDQVGGWAVSWPLKFRDTASLGLDTTANTYTCILWYPLAEDKVLAIAGSTGVAL